MAAIEKDTKYYYKINFDKCAVKGLKVFVNYSIYESVEDREKEKVRKEKVVEFFENIRLHTQFKYKELIEAVEKKGLVPEEIMDKESGQINGKLYPKLRTMQDKLCEMEDVEVEIGDRLFALVGVEKQELKIPKPMRKELEAMGFELEWITDPIRLNGGGEVYAGEYEGEPITYELFYDRLKTVMGATEDY